MTRFEPPPVYRLYEALLQVSEVGEPETFLEQALALVVEATGAQLGYVTLGTEPDGTNPTWTRARGASGGDVAAIREALSSGILHQAHTTGEVVHTASALDDDRFRDRASVKRNAIEAVLCLPLRAPETPDVTIGVLYLQGRAEPGPFSDAEVELAVLSGRHLGAPAQRIIRRSRWERPDPTAPYRETLAVDMLIGRSKALARLFHQVGIYAPHDARLILRGERGTGKTTLAHAIHVSSGRRDGPFVKVDCARLTAHTLSAELFGARRGAYTGLDRDRIGKVELANGGTLFLEEVGLLGREEQQMLLTFLDDQTYQRLGGTRTQEADVRVIGATNEHLDDRCEAGTFRWDLRERLGHEIEVPSLSARADDIELLADKIIEQYAQQFSVARRPLTPAALLWCQRQPWPGNIRALEKVLQTGLLEADFERASVINLHHLNADGRDRVELEASADDLRTAQRSFRRQHIQSVLERNDHHRGRAAAALGISVAQLYALLNSLDLRNPAS